jgi:hypothetical protein
MNHPLPWVEFLTFVQSQYAKQMWKYILASILFLIGIVEIVLALHSGLREALMQTSPLRLKQAESSAFLFAGISALVMGIGILFYGLFW